MSFYKNSLKSDASSTTSCCNNRTVFRLLTATEKRTRFLKRLTRIRHMDFEYALWQAAYLLISPQKVYRNFQYRKCSRDQWARDDPAFFVILILTVICTSVGFGLMIHFSLFQIFKFVMWVIFIDFIASGMLVATVFWFVTNRFMRLTTSPGDPDVEWGYSFDIHLNAFFPLIIILHLVQLPFLNIITYQYWFSPLLGNLFWLIALLYYNYITFLGYRALSFLRDTKVLLYPMTVFLMFYIISIILHWNLTVKLEDFYYYRIISY